MNKLHRALTIFAATSVAAVGLVGVNGTPAFAGQTSCVNGGGYSWFSETATVTGDEAHVEIDVYKGSGCSGTTILQGVVETNHGENYYSVWANDGKCDSIGMRVEMHNYSLGTDGCNNSPQPFGTPLMSSIGSPKNFWLYINSTSNTSAYNLPPAE